MSNDNEQATKPAPAQRVQVEGGVMSMQCQTTVILNKSLVSDVYGDCLNPAKYRVSYKDGVKGNRVTRTVCGVHKRSIEKQAAGLKNRTGYDSELVIEDLT